ncbi:hypothetical protein AB0E25_40065 [Streptomyces bobili]|uniref:hypothetical protein n=1 Tax=Streptomyces bobili TaxID=67280 RepID=UPI0033FFEB2D
MGLGPSQLGRGWHQIEAASPQLTVADLDVFPVYLRLGGNNEWCLDDASVTVNGTHTFSNPALQAVAPTGPAREAPSRAICGTWAPPWPATGRRSPARRPGRPGTRPLSQRRPVTSRWRG